MVVVDLPFLARATSDECRIIVADACNYGLVQKKWGYTLADYSLVVVSSSACHWLNQLDGNFGKG